jgi:hypothetical protein
MRQVVSFKDIPIGSEFDDGVTEATGIRQGTPMWQTYRKVDKLHAVCTGQFGYGNTRLVGTERTFSPWRAVCYPALRP